MNGNFNKFFNGFYGISIHTEQVKDQRSSKTQIVDDEFSLWACGIECVSLVHGYTECVLIIYSDKHVW